MADANTRPGERQVFLSGEDDIEAVCRDEPV